MVKYEDFTVGDIQSHSQWNVCRGQVQSVKPEERNRAEPTSRSRHVTNTFSFCHQTWTHRVLNDEQERSTWGDGNHTVGLWTRHNSELNQRQHSPVGGTSGGRTRTLGFCGAVEAGPCDQTVYWWRTPGPEGREEPGSQHTEPESGAPEPPSEEAENNVRTTDEIELGFIFYWILTGSKCGLRPSSCPRDNMVENGPRFFINHSVLELDPFTQPGPGVWWNEQKIFWLNDETDVKAALWLVGPAQTWLRFGQEGEQEVLQHHAPLFQTHSLKVVDEHLQPGYNDEKKPRVREYSRTFCRGEIQFSVISQMNSGHLHLLVRLTAEVSVSQTAQKTGWRGRQEQAQTSREPGTDGGTVHQLLIRQHRQSHLCDHVQNHGRWRDHCGRRLWNEAVMSHKWNMKKLIQSPFFHWNMFLKWNFFFFYIKILNISFEQWLSLRTFFCAVTSTHHLGQNVQRWVQHVGQFTEQHLPQHFGITALSGQVTL